MNRMHRDAETLDVAENFRLKEQYVEVMTVAENHHFRLKKREQEQYSFEFSFYLKNKLSVEG